MNIYGSPTSESDTALTLDWMQSLMMLHIVLFRELFRISISNYQDWFKVAITFWLQTFREECMRRIEKALEIEKDV